MTERRDRDPEDDVPAGHRPDTGPGARTGPPADAGADPLADFLAEVDGGGAGATRAPAVRHRFDPGGPLAGLFFLAAAGVFLASGLSGESVVELRVLVPVVLIGLGVVGIVRIVTRVRRRHLR